MFLRKLAAIIVGFFVGLGLSLLAALVPGEASAREVKYEHGNCLFFALEKWTTSGGYVLFRKSHYGCWPHFMWAERIDGVSAVEFSPEEKIQRILPPIVFRGAVGFVKVEGKKG